MTATALRVALVGPYPPPHGGISVHVAGLYRRLVESGGRCRVLDTGGHREPDAKVATRDGQGGGKFALLSQLGTLARHGWPVHVHTNGHNRRSWLLVLACGRAARRAPARIVTLHSGMLPDYLASGEVGARALARIALAPYERVVCVSAAVRDAVAELDLPPSRLVVAPAALPVGFSPAAVPDAWCDWMAAHRPLAASALFFRPEYGFDLLVELVARLAPRHPGFGCVVMGGGDGGREAAAAVRERGLERHFLFTGDVEHELCLTLMARADVFVRPARADGDAVSVREALALGVPVVASDAAVRPAGVVRFAKGDAGALAETVEAVLCLPEMPVTRSREGDGAFERLMETYRALCAEKEGAWPRRSWAS